MIITKEAFSTAINSIELGTPESNQAMVDAFFASDTFKYFIKRAQDVLGDGADPVAALGTLFQIGFEAGLAYQAGQAKAV